MAAVQRSAFILNRQSIKKWNLCSPCLKLLVQNSLHMCNKKIACVNLFAGASSFWVKCTSIHKSCIFFTATIVTITCLKKWSATVGIHLMTTSTWPQYHPKPFHFNLALTLIHTSCKKLWRAWGWSNWHWERDILYPSLKNCMNMKGTETWKTKVHCMTAKRDVKKELKSFHTFYYLVGPQTLSILFVSSTWNSLSSWDKTQH